jgi:two-component system, chemotaxis family, chemotaxis protein CheY
MLKRKKMDYKDKKALVVDDSKLIRQNIMKVLKDLGFGETMGAENGTVGLKKLGKEPVDLIVSDWINPGMTGLELLKAVRADAKLKGTAFIMVTSQGNKEKVMEAVQAGVNQFIVKPFNAIQLEEKINAIKF